MTGNLIDSQIKKMQQTSDYTTTKQSYNTSYANVKTPYPTADSYNNQTPKKEPSGPFWIFLSWLGLNGLSDGFNRACSTENYDKSILGRLGRLGDTISAKCKNSKVLTAIKGYAKSVKSSVKNFIDKRPLLSSMFRTPTVPESKMVIGFMENQHTADLKEAADLISKYTVEKPTSFKDLKATSAELDSLKTKYGTGLFGKIKNKNRALLELQFDRLGCPKGYIDTLAPENISEALKNAKIKHLGFADKAAFDAAIKEPEKFATEIINACKKGGKNAKVTLCKIPLLKRFGNLGASANKLTAETAHASKLGRFMAKFPKTLMRALTFGGGRINSLLVALGLGTAAVNTIKAPKDKKAGTAAGGFVDAVSWIISIPLAIKAMYGINGMKYVGMGATPAEQKIRVAKYRDALKAFNLDQKAGKLTNKTTYLRRLAELNKLKTPNVKLNKFQSFMRKFADKALGIGLEVPRPYQEATAGLTGKALRTAKKGNFKRMLGYLTKNGAAYPIRFAAYLFIFSKLVDKIISGCTNAIFGKPYEPPEDEAQKTEDINNQNISVADKTNESENKNKIDIEQLPDDNLIKRVVHGEKIVKDKYIPSENCEIEGYTNSVDENNRSYIPNDEVFIQSTEEADKVRVAKAIARADKIEQSMFKYM